MDTADMTAGARVLVEGCGPFTLMSDARIVRQPAHYVVLDAEDAAGERGVIRAAPRDVTPAEEEAR